MTLNDNLILLDEKSSYKSRVYWFLLTHEEE